MQMKSKKMQDEKSKKNKLGGRRVPSWCAHTPVLLIIYTAAHFYNAEQIPEQFSGAVSLPVKANALQSWPLATSWCSSQL